VSRAGHRDRGPADQVEIVRDSFAGLVLVIRSFAVTVVGVVSGLLSLEPVIAALVVPLFLLGLAAARVRTSLRADEDLASTAGSVFAGVRDITAGGAEDFASDLVSEPIEAHAAAERALARGGCPADRVLRLGRLAATADPGRLRTLAGGPRCNHRNVAWRPHLRSNRAPAGLRHRAGCAGRQRPAIRRHARPHPRQRGSCRPAPDRRRTARPSLADGASHLRLRCRRASISPWSGPAVSASPPSRRWPAEC
jgi:hypothetical protein